MLAEVIAEAFFDLPPSRWLIPDPAARREIFPGYFRLLVREALAAGVVHTTPGRDAAALWLPAGPPPAPPPDGYTARLAAVTGPWTGRFPAFDAALAAAPYPAAGIRTSTWPSWPSAPTGRARAPAPRCWTPTSTASTPTCTCPPTWKPPASGPAASTSATATSPSRAHRSASPMAVRRCGPWSVSPWPAPVPARQQRPSRGRRTRKPVPDSPFPRPRYPVLNSPDRKPPTGSSP